MVLVMSVPNEQPSNGDDPIALTDWLENQKERAEERIEDERE